MVMKIPGAFVCIFSYVPFVLTLAACAQDSRDSFLGQVKQVVESQTGSVDINGRVLSSDGESLEDVTVDYYFRKANDVLTDAEIEEESLTVDGEFYIRGRNISSVNLWISKKGYYTEQWSYGFDADITKDNPGGLERVDVDIVLSRQPSPAPLKRFSGFLRSDPLGPISVVETTREGPGESWLRKNGKEKAIGWPHILLVPALADDSKTIREKSFVANGNRKTMRGLEKGWIRFGDSKPGDGFVVFDPGTMPPKPEVAMRKMSYAPDSGYSQDLEISLADSNEQVFFFCRFDGQYGKGMVGSRPRILVENGVELARTLVLVFMNPTGSRDVSYIHR